MGGVFILRVVIGLFLAMFIILGTKKWDKENDDKSI